MSVLPKKQAETINWVTARLEPWTTNATAIGLTSAQVTALTNLVSNVSANVAELNAAKVALQNAQLTFAQNYEAMRAMAGAYIKVIRSRAQATNNPFIYVQASIPPPATPTPSGTPAAPSDLIGTLTNDGFVELKWTSSLRASTFFTIWRQLPGETDFVQVGTIGAKKFTDNSIPAGSAYASYRVYANRGTTVSESSEVLQMVFGVPQQQAA